MAVRQNQQATEDQAPVQSGGGGFGLLGNPFIIMLALVAVGFLSNNYLIAEQKAHDTGLEYRGYQEAVKDVR